MTTAPSSTKTLTLTEAQMQALRGDPGTVVLDQLPDQALLVMTLDEDEAYSEDYSHDRYFVPMVLTAAGKFELVRHYYAWKIGLG
jgi:hypothetical protein